MLGGGLPGEVRRHAPLLQGLPDILLVPVEVQRPLQHVQHVMGVVVQEKVKPLPSPVYSL